MKTKSFTLDFSDGQIIKSGLPNDRRENFLPSVAGFAYYWLRIGGQLENIGLILWDASVDHRRICGKIG